MDENSILQYIADTFPGVDAMAASGDTFFIYDPQRDLPPQFQRPFATLVTSDSYERVSDLNRPGVYRLNIGVSKDTYRSLFGDLPPPPKENIVVQTGHDFAALDVLMPHPVYAPQAWIGVLNPSETTFETIKGFLAEAYNTAVRKYDKRAASGD